MNKKDTIKKITEIILDILKIIKMIIEIAKV
jgi:hypothetical protein